MRRRDGIGLILSLIILVIIAAFGVGAMFLSLTNLRLAENKSANTAAFYRSRAGMDSGLVVLATSWADVVAVNGASAALPATQSDVQTLFTSTLGNVGFGNEFLLEGYNRLANDSAVLKIRGTSASGGVYVTETLFQALLESQPGVPGGEDCLICDGLVSNGYIFGTSAVEVDVNVWAGAGINFTGQATISAGNYARTADGKWCKVGSSSDDDSDVPCENGTDADGNPIPSPNVSAPVWSDIYATMATTAADDVSIAATCDSSNTVTTAMMTSFDWVLQSLEQFDTSLLDPLPIHSPPATVVTVDETWVDDDGNTQSRGTVETYVQLFFHQIDDPQDRLICLDPGVRLVVGGTIQNTIILGEPYDSTTDPPVEGSEVIVADTDSTGQDTTVGTSGTDARGLMVATDTFLIETPVPEIYGQNTFFSRQDMILPGKLSVNPVPVCTDPSDTSTCVNGTGTFFISEGDIIINGNGNRDIYASFWAGGGLTLNGASVNLYGSIITAAVGYDATDPAIKLNGKNTVINNPLNSNYEIVPPTPPTPPVSAGLRILTRR